MNANLLLETRMRMISRYWTFVVGLLTSVITSSVAQEMPVVTSQQQMNIFGGSGVTPPTLPTQQYFDELLDPILREKRLIREARAAEASRRAQQNATPQQAMASTVHFGNTADGNYSPYPDRELDARVLSFPMSKQSLRRNEQKIERLRQSKK